MEICIKWNICRVCLREEEKKSKEDDKGCSDQMRHLFDGDKKLSLHIYELFGVFMKPDDSLPDKICDKCVSIITKAVQLRKSCRSSNAYLQSVLKRTKSASTMFKPEILQCQINNDEIEDVKMEAEHTNLDKGEDDAQNIETNEILEHHEDEVEQEATDTISEAGVELEQIIEISEEEEDHIFMQTIENDTDEDSGSTQYIKDENAKDPSLNEKCLKPETSQLKNFYMSGSFLKIKNTEEDSNNSKEINDEFYNNNNLNDNQEDLEEREDLHSVTDKNFEYVTIEEEALGTNCDETLALQSEENLNDNENQDLVTSTVETNDEIEYYEHDYNPSHFASDLEEDGLVDRNLESNISSSKPSPEETGDPNLHSNETEIKSVYFTRKRIISPRRKIKRNLHKKTKRGQVPVCVCEICGNRFTNRNLMKIHMRVHYQEKNHQCELCCKSFITACNLQAHMRIHTGEKPFQCKYCGRRFSDRSSNLRHERTHTNEKPFDCDNCGKSFSLFTTLQNHMKVHTNERSYRCDPCGKSFKLAHHLKAHQNTSLHRSMVQIDNVVAT